MKTFDQLMNEINIGPAKVSANLKGDMKAKYAKDGQTFRIGGNVKKRKINRISYHNKNIAGTNTSGSIAYDRNQGRVIANLKRKVGGGNASLGAYSGKNDTGIMARLNLPTSFLQGGNR